MSFLPDFSNNTHIILSILFLSLAFIQFFWVFFFYTRISFHKDKTKTFHLPISIIIVAKNEEDNLFQFLPFVLEQDYEEFEVIVVNHQSTDDTEYILNAFSKKYPHLRVISFDQGKHATYGKKLPLTIGIKGAKYEHLLLTDADCKPSSNQWVKSMAKHFSKNKKMVLGYAPLNHTPGFLNRIIRVDTTFVALNYLSYAKAGIPYMGVGRNLAYTKGIFMDNKGFKSHYSISSGDDDLFVQEVASRKNCAISLTSEALTFSKAKDTWRDWLAQKSRHYSTSPKYSFFKKIMLGIYPLTMILLFTTFFILLLNNGMNWLLLSVLFFLLAVKWLFLGLAFKKLEQKTLAWGILFWDIFYALFIPIIYYSRQQTQDRTWK